MSELIIGIDLGTTNSEVAAFVGDQVKVLGPADSPMLPSCVGFSASGELLVGEPARNQLALYPDRTVRSIKRKMGSAENVQMAGKEFSPQEISAVILAELVQWAHRAIGERPLKAVITVPAYFSDAQRNATREAGALAGLEVVRILNEPTAASLAYGHGDGARHTALIYDLGGGTFDVSVVTTEGDITEVLASHGNNHLSGDDFDDRLAGLLADEFQRHTGIYARQSGPAAKARLWWAAEEAKKKLSFEPYVKVREEALVIDRGKPFHLDVEISRERYEELIRPLVESTLDSVSRALQDARKNPGDIDAILLVGGSTRTPLVSRLLHERTGLQPRQDVHPDLCVALGAGVLASRLAGHNVERILVDVSPFSFGVSYLGERGGVEYPHCYKPIIERNTPLPLTRTERYYTCYAEQTAVQVHIYQGEDEDALRNIPVGDFLIEGLTSMNEPNEVLCRMRLDLDGILEVAAIEKRTGKLKHIRIEGALRSKSPEEIAAARKRIQDLFSSRADVEHDSETDDGEIVEVDVAEHTNGKIIEMPAERASEAQEALKLVERSRTLLDRMHPDDREEAIALHESILTAVQQGELAQLAKAVQSLKELLFFVEGQG